MIFDPEGRPVTLEYQFQMHKKRVEELLLACAETLKKMDERLKKLEERVK